jgi:acetoin utilization deacetylase AcuC-like enzyme
MPFCAFHRDYSFDWPGHVFPVQKFGLVHQKLLREGGFAPADFAAPALASEEDILLAHRSDYWTQLQDLAREGHDYIPEFEAPLNERILRSVLLHTGGSILAARCALERGLGVNLGGGFHHAFPDHGEGFCYVNDIAVAVRRLLRDGRIRRAFVLDCDVHQGNGTAVIFQDEPEVFTYSIHQENNYPPKERSTLDVGLDDDAGDDEYLEALERTVPDAVGRHRPDLLVYVAGADPYRMDLLGGLDLTKEGFGRRDRFTYDLCRTRGIPLLLLLAGGYAQDMTDVIDIHVRAIVAAREALLRDPERPSGNPPRSADR